MNVVDLGSNEIVNDAVWSTYKWTFVMYPAAEDASEGLPGSVSTIRATDHIGQQEVSK